MDIDVPLTAPSVQLSVGHSQGLCLAGAGTDMGFAEGPVAQSQAQKNQSKQERVRQTPEWCMGPIALYEDILTQSQISCIFIKGPSYTGTFQAEESPLTDNLSSLSCHLLHLCAGSGKSAQSYIEMLGWKGLDMVNDRLNNQSTDKSTSQLTDYQSI